MDGWMDGWMDGVVVRSRPAHRGTRKKEHKFLRVSNLHDEKRNQNIDHNPFGSNHKLAQQQCTGMSALLARVPSVCSVNAKFANSRNNIRP